jgi:hypothetical protein
MPFPIKVCAICSEEFELKPDKLGFANRCPKCSTPEPDPGIKDADESRNDSEMNEARKASDPQSFVPQG